MSLTYNLLMYIVLSLGIGTLLRSIKNEDDSPKIRWVVSGLIIGILGGLLNAGLSGAGLGFSHAFNLDTRLGLFLGSLGAGLLISTAIGMMTAYDMARRFTIINGWLLFFKIIIIFVVIGGTISSLSIAKYTTEQWFDFFIFGLAQGGIYALVALGYTLVYGILFMINFAHGEIFMSGAFTAFFMANALAKSSVKGQPTFLDTNPVTSLFLIFLVAITTSTVIAVLLERIAYRPLRRAPRLVPLITAIGASFFLQYSFRGFYGSGIQSYPQVKALQGDLLVGDVGLFLAVASVIGVGVLLLRPLYNLLKEKFIHASWLPPFTITLILLIAISIVYNILVESVAISTRFGYALPISRLQFVVVLASILMMSGLYMVVQYTKIGKAMRAVSEDKDVAALMGIDVDRVISITFGMGAALAGGAGVLYALIFRQVHFFMGFLPGLKAFTAAVLGGIGNVPGAMLGGLFLGIFESVGPSLFLEGLGIPSSYQLKDVIAFTMLVLVLIFRPTGIMGVELSKKKA